MKRSPMKRGKARGWNSTLRPRTSHTASDSPQRARKRAADAEYQIARGQRLVRVRGLCERCGSRSATQTHHVKRRSQGVDHSVENLRALCLWCHTHVHAHVKESKEAGWLA